MAIAFTVPAGSEETVCKNFVLPEDLAYIGRFESRSSFNLHHLIVFPTGLTNDQVTDDLIRNCDENAEAQEVRLGFTYGSQTDRDEVPLPDGIGYRTVTGLAMQLEFHVLNTSDAPIDVEGAVNLWKADEPIVGEAGVLFMYHPWIAIEPGATATVRQKCPIAEDIHLLTLIGHMHSRGLQLHASLADGTSLAEIVGWDTNSLNLSPAVDLAAGQIIDYSCDFRNDTPDLIVEGPSGTRNEMCVTGGIYYKDVGERMLIQDEICRGKDIVWTGTNACTATQACVTAIDWSDWSQTPSPADQYELCQVKQCTDTSRNFDACRFQNCDGCFVKDTQGRLTQLLLEDPACLSCTDAMCPGLREICAADACP